MGYNKVITVYAKLIPFLVTEVKSKGNILFSIKNETVPTTCYKLIRILNNTD